MTDATQTEQPTIIFLHIMKTAGTTLNVIFESHFGRENSFATFPNRLHPEGSLEAFRALSDAEKARIDFLTGHMGFGLHRELPRPAVYITLLRNPVERVISRYFHERRDPHSFHHELIHNGMDLTEYVRLYAEELHMDNLQTRVIAGNWEKRGSGPCTPEMLATAKQNLVEYFAVCGLVERFDAFLLLLNHTFNWPPVYYHRHNVSSSWRRADDFPAATIEVIRQYNQYDQELYDFAAARFDKQLQQLGPNVVWRERAFVLRNGLHDLYRDLRRHSLRQFLRSWRGR